MKKLIVTVGIPGCGKSLWSSEQVPPDGRGVIIVNKDDIRTTLTSKGWTWSHENEKDVIKERDAQILAALAHPDIHTVISSDTNFGRHVGDLRRLAESMGADFFVKRFTVPVDECVRRDGLRVGKAHVGEKVIRTMAEANLTPYQLFPGRQNPQLFLDLDGVFADFDGYVKDNFGWDRTKPVDDHVFWTTLRESGNPHIFRDFKPMPYAQELWAALKSYNPVILTGAAYSIPNCTQDKREWVAKYLDPDVKVPISTGRTKSKYCEPGDILLDDWSKPDRIAKWQDAGGVWITHIHPHWQESVRLIKQVMGSEGVSNGV